MVCSVVTVCIMSWLSSSPNQNSGHAVGDSNLNTSQCSLFLFILSVAVDGELCLVMNCNQGEHLHERN